MRDEGQRDGIQREGDEVECKSKLKHEKQKNEKKKESAGGFFPPPHTEFHFGKKTKIKIRAQKKEKK